MGRVGLRGLESTIKKPGKATWISVVDLNSAHSIQMFQDGFESASTFPGWVTVEKPSLWEGTLGPALVGFEPWVPDG